MYIIYIYIYIYHAFYGLIYSIRYGICYLSKYENLRYLLIIYSIKSTLKTAIDKLDYTSAYVEYKI